MWKSLGLRPGFQIQRVLGLKIVYNWLLLHRFWLCVYTFSRFEGLLGFGFEIFRLFRLWVFEFEKLPRVLLRQVSRHITFSLFTIKSRYLTAILYQYFKNKRFKMLSHFSSMKIEWKSIESICYMMLLLTVRVLGSLAMAIVAPFSAIFNALRP